MSSKDGRADRLLALEARVVALEAAVRELRTAAPAADLDSVLSVKETALAIGKSPVTLMHWLGDAHAFERYNLNALMRRDPTGHWRSSPRLVARWKQVAFVQLCELAR